MFACSVYGALIIHVVDIRYNQIESCIKLLRDENQSTKFHKICLNHRDWPHWWIIQEFRRTYCCA